MVAHDGRRGPPLRGLWGVHPVPESATATAPATATATTTATTMATAIATVTTTAASDTITFGVDIDSATDGTSITIADTDKLLIDDSGTTKYVNASQVETYINPKGKAIAMAIVFG